MTNDDEHAQHEQQGHVHLHRAALSDEWQRLRLTLTMLHVAMQGDWPDTLTQELANHASTARHRDVQHRGHPRR